MNAYRSVLLVMLVVGSMLTAPVGATNAPSLDTAASPVTQSPPESERVERSTESFEAPTTLTGDQSFSLENTGHRSSAASKSNAVTTKQDGQPTAVWNKTYGGSHAEEGQAIVSTADGGFVTAGYATQEGSRDGQLIKVDSDGTIAWSHTYGGSSDQRAYDVATTADGGYVIAGVTQPNNPQDDGKADMWLVKVDESGHEVWTRTYGGQQSDYAYSVTTTADGGYALAGWTNSSGAGSKDVWLVKVDSAGHKEFDRTYGGQNVDKGQAIVQTDSGGYAIAGWTNSSGAGSDDMLLVRTTSTGEKQWSNTYGGSMNEGVFRHGLTATNDGGFALAGWTESYSIGFDDMWLVKVDESGSKQWSEAYGRSLNDVATSVIQTPDGGYALSGYTRTYDGDNYDSWLIKTNATGGEQWNKTVGGGQVDVGTDLTRANGGNYVVSGYTNSAGSGSYDTWLVNVSEPAGPVPTIDTTSVTLTPYPVEQGSDPVLTLAASNAQSVNVRVSLPETGQSVRVPMTTVSSTRYQLDLSSVSMVDGLPPGTEVDLTIIASNEAGTDRVSNWLSGATQTQFLQTNADLDYYVFKDVKDVAVVLGSFPDQTPPDAINGLPGLAYWETSMELDANNYFGSGRGSMGAVGFDFNYLDNNEQLYELPEPETYYGKHANPDWLYNNVDDCPGDKLGYFASSKCGAHFFLEDLKQQSGLDPSKYHAWIGTHPGRSFANPSENPALDWSGNQYTGVHFDPNYADNNEERSYFPISQFILTGLHELGHGTPMQFAHPTNKDNRVSLMGYEAQFSPTGEQEIPPISTVHRLGELRFSDADNAIDWLEPNRTTITNPNRGQTNLEVKAFNGYDLGEEVPIIRVPAQSTDGTTPVDFVFAGDPDEFHKTDRFDNESVRVYRVRGNNVTRYFGPGNQAEKGVSVGFGSGLQLEYETIEESNTGEDYRATVGVDLDTLPSNTNTVMLKDSVSVPSNFVGRSGRFNYTTPDLNLVATDNQGRRVGPTESGEYVNEIPGATTSGETNGLEWISVPEDADVEFTVNSDSVETFLNQTNISSENVSVNYETAVTHLDSNPEVTQEDDTYTATNTTTELAANRSVDPGTTTAAVNDSVIADFKIGPRKPHPNRSVTFNASLSTTLDGSINQYTWTYGNGTTATGETISRTYTQSGTYTLSLTVTDTNGQTASTEKTFRVADRPPTARLTVQNNDPIAGQTDVTLSAGASTDFIGISEFRWDTNGDDTIERVTNTTTTTIAHTYEEPGTYKPTVTAVDTTGQTDTASRTLTVDAPQDTDDSPDTPTNNDPKDSPPETNPPESQPNTANDNSDPATETDTQDGTTNNQPTIKVRHSGPDTTFVISNVTTNQNVSITVPDRTRPSSAPAEITAVNLTLSEPVDQFNLTIPAPTTTPPEGVPALNAGSGTSYVTVASESLANTTLTEATIQFVVPQQALPEAATPQNVTLYQYHNESWRQLKTTALSTNQYIANTSSVSTFAVSTPTASMATPTSTTTRPTSTTPSTSTPTPTTSTPPTEPATQPPTSTSMGSTPGFGVVIALITILCTTVLAYRR